MVLAMLPSAAFEDLPRRCTLLECTLGVGGPAVTPGELPDQAYLGIGELPPVDPTHAVLEEQTESAGRPSTPRPPRRGLLQRDHPSE